MLFFFTLAFVIRWAFASWTSSIFFFNPGLRDTLGICLLDQHLFFFGCLCWGSLTGREGLRE